MVAWPAVHPMQVRHRRIERKKIIERQRLGSAIKRQRLVATQADPIGIADWRNRCQPVERAAQHDHQEARVAPFGERGARQIRPGEQDAGCEQ